MPGLFARFSHRFVSSIGADADTDDAAAPNDDEEQQEQLSVLFRASGALFRKSKTDNEYNELLSNAAVEVSLDLGAAPHVTLYLIVREKGTEDELMRVSLIDAGVMTYHFPTVMWPCIVNGKVRRFAFEFSVSDTTEGLTAERVAEKFIAVYRQSVYAAHVQKAPTLTEDPDDDVAYVASMYAAAEEHDGAAEPDPAPPAAATASHPAAFRATSTSTGAGQAPNVWLNDVSRYGRIMTTKANGTLEFTPYTEAGLGGPVVVEAQTGGKSRITKATDVVVAKGDTKAAMLPSDDGAAAVTMIDVETGAVDEYMPGLEYRMSHLSLYGGRGDGGNPDLLVCSNASSCFTIDTRLDPSKCAVVESGKSLVDYTYAKRKDQTFTCHATTAAGYVATGDAVGQIRLFSGPPGSAKATGKGHYPKVAKTLLATTASHPIRHVDITADGKYIVATTKEYVLVVCTKMPNSEKLGFTERMGGAKPQPTRLDVPPEVQAELGAKLSLTRATFGVDQETGEHVITCSAGAHLLVWELDAVQNAIPSRARVTCATQQVAVAPHLVCANNGHVAFVDSDGIGVGLLPRRGKICSRF